MEFISRIMGGGKPYKREVGSIAEDRAHAVGRNVNITHRAGQRLNQPHGLSSDGDTSNSTVEGVGSSYVHLGPFKLLDGGHQRSSMMYIFICVMFLLLVLGTFFTWSATPSSSTQLKVETDQGPHVRAHVRAHPPKANAVSPAPARRHHHSASPAGPQHAPHSDRVHLSHPHAAPPGPEPTAPLPEEETTLPVSASDEIARIAALEARKQTLVSKAREIETQIHQVEDRDADAAVSAYARAARSPPRAPPEPGPMLKPHARVAGMGTGASKNLKELSKKEATVALKGFVGSSGHPATTGYMHPSRSFVLNRARWSEGDDLPFPRKKLRFHLTHYSLGKVTKQLLAVLPDQDEVRLAMPESQKFGRCAVVGNGGSLLLHRLGPQIDAHDVVIRLNGGPTRGWEAHVGRRTTFRLTNRMHMGFAESQQERVLQHVSTPDALDKFVEVARSAQQQGHRVFALDPDFHEFAMTFMDKGVLSNGFYGILLASELCINVSVFGFLRRWRDRTNYHYYDSIQPDGQQSLRDDKEGDRLEYFLGNRSHTHSYGEPCMVGSVGNTPQFCEGCAPQARCDPDVWHPVPEPGYCYNQRRLVSGLDVPDVSCFHKCTANEQCAGGLAGVCHLAKGRPSSKCAHSE